MKPDKNTLEKLYLVDKLTTRAIAEIYGVRHISIGRWLTSYGIRARPNGRGLANRGVLEPTRDELFRMIHLEFNSYQDVAEKYGVDSSAIRHWLLKHDIPFPEAWQSRRKSIRQQPNISEVSALYDSGQSIMVLAEKYGVHANQIRDWITADGVEIRCGGWNGSHRLVCNDGHRVRSTYELRVDNWLFEQGVEHAYEPAYPFDRRFHADFFANGWFIEIWGVGNSPTYKKRANQKISLCEINNFPLIEIPFWAFDKAHTGQWKRSLRRCLVSPHD